MASFRLVFCLALSLFRVGITKRLSKVRSLEPPAHAGNLKERTFETHFNLRTGRPRKTTVSNPRKKAHPKAQKPKAIQTKGVKPKTPMTDEAKRESRRKYEKTPERQEAHRRYVQEQRERKKSRGLCKDCPNQAIQGQIRCPTCAEKNRQSHRRNGAKP